MTPLCSEAAQRHRELAEKSQNLNWLNGPVDVGAVVAKDEADAKKVLDDQLANNVRLLSESAARAAAKQQGARAYYIVGRVDNHSTWSVADCFADFNPQSVAIKITDEAAIANSSVEHEVAEKASV